MLFLPTLNHVTDVLFLYVAAISKPSDLKRDAGFSVCLRVGEMKNMLVTYLTTVIILY